MSDNHQEGPQDPPSIYQHLSVMLEQIAQLSWAKLGLQPDIITGKLETNLAEAKVAIDLTAHIAMVVESQLDEADRRQLHSIVRDLRINYVRKTTEANG